MAIALLPNKPPIKLPNDLMAGSFTGNYSNRAQMAQLAFAASTFTDEMKKVVKVKPERNDEVYAVSTKLEGPGLPFTAALASEVGFYGLRWGRFDLCKYYKRGYC